MAETVFLPVLGGDDEFFWTSGRDGVLRILRCVACGRYVHPPSPRCAWCGGDDLVPSPVSGLARLLTSTLKGPLVIGVFELDEQPGLRLVSNLTDCPTDEVAIGMRVEAHFVRREDVWLPQFRPSGP